MTNEEREPLAGEPESLEGLEGAVAAAEDDNSALREELERTKAAYARAMADYQNLQRRSREDRAEQTRLTMKTLVLNYLPVLDDLNRALDSIADHEEIVEHPWVEGVRMVQRKFVAILEGAGVTQIDAAPGAPFDPQQHEAVANVPGPLNQVLAVVQNGYAIDHTMIRPAMVVVGNGEEPPAG
jgi:molecular chaperone GrpE